MGSTLSTRPPSSANDKRLQYIVGSGFCASVGRHNGVSNAVRDAHAGHHQAGHRDGSESWINGTVWFAQRNYLYLKPPSCAAFNRKLLYFTCEARLDCTTWPGDPTATYEPPKAPAWLHEPEDRVAPSTHPSVNHTQRTRSRFSHPDMADSVLIARGEEGSANILFNA